MEKAISVFENEHVSANPKIVVFTCNWCSYAGADLAGVSRIQYPTNIRIIRLMCTGRLEPELVMKTLSYGADGVLVLGCHIGDCHYMTGNHRAQKRIVIVKRMLEYLGIDPRRLRLDYCSASEGAKFAQIMREFTAEIKNLGIVKEVSL